MWLGYLLIGMSAGVLAGLFGIGGGIIIVPSLIWLFTWQQLSSDWIPHLAIATSLATVIGTGIVATSAHQRHGAVQWVQVRRLTPGLMIGALIGSSVLHWLPDVWLIRLFALFLLVVAWRFIRPARVTPTASTRPSGALTIASLFIGLVSAIIGIGGGTLIVPLLIKHGLTLRHAVATSSACGIAIALLGTIGFIIHGWHQPGLPAHSIGWVYWPAALAILMGSIPTAPLGARWAQTLPTAVLKRLFAVFLVIVALRLFLH